MTDLDARLRAAAQSWQHSIDNGYDKDNGLDIDIDIDSIDYVDRRTVTPHTPGSGPHRRARLVAVAASVCLVIGSVAFFAARQERHASTAAAGTCLQKLVMTDFGIAQSDPPQISVTVTNNGPAACPVDAAPPTVQVINSAGRSIGTLTAPKHSYGGLIVAPGASVSVGIDSLLLPDTAKFGHYRARLRLSHTTGGSVTHSPLFTIDLGAMAGEPARRNAMLTADVSSVQKLR